MGDLSRVPRDLVAGYGESVISPPPGVELCGYGFYRGRRAESILDDLKARAVCISGNGTTLILIACDLLGFDVETSDTIRKMIADEHHVPISNILLAGTSPARAQAGRLPLAERSPPSEGWPTCPP